MSFTPQDWVHIHHIMEIIDHACCHIERKHNPFKGSFHTDRIVGSGVLAIDIYKYCMGIKNGNTQIQS